MLSLTIAALATLPTGSYTGNFADVIRVEQSLDVTSDLTIRNFGVPIHFVFGRVQVVAKVAPFPVVTLTVEPGAELRFDDYISFGIVGGGGEHTGVLRAIGTAATKIIFTSAKSARAAGDWPGIWLRSAQGSQLDHVVIEYAGGPNGIISNNCRPAMSTDNAALTVGNFTASYVPSAASFTNLEIRDTSSHDQRGLERRSVRAGSDGWRELRATPAAGRPRTTSPPAAACSRVAWWIRGTALQRSNRSSPARPRA